MRIEIKDCPPFPCVEGVTFRHLPDWAGYAVSDDGHIWSCKEQFGRGIAPWHRLVAVPTKRTGHLTVLLNDHGRRRRVGVHILVLTGFVGPPLPGMQCRHYPDPTPSNNRIGNLQWGNHQQNVDDCVQMRRHRNGDSRGELNGMAKLTEQQVVEIHGLCGRETLTQIGKRFGISPGDVSLIGKGKAWKHLNLPPHKSFVLNCVHVGETNGSAKLKADEVVEIRRCHAAGELTQVELATKFKVTQALISQIVLRKTWRNL